MSEYIWQEPKKWPPEAERKIFWNISCPRSIKSLQVRVKYNTRLSLESLWVHHFAHGRHQSICSPYVFCFRLLYKAELPGVFLLSSVVFLIWPPPPFSFFSGLWTSSTLGSCFHLQLCFGQGKKFCQWKQEREENKKGCKGCACVAALWWPTVGSIHSLRSRLSRALLLLETDGKWSEIIQQIISFSHLRNNKMQKLCWGKLESVTYINVYLPTPCSEGM